MIRVAVEKFTFPNLFSVCMALLVPLCIGASLIYFVDAPSDKSLALSLFITAIWLWIFELLPVSITALLIPILMVMYGVRGVEQAFSPFSSSIIFLFLGVFLLGISFQKHGLDRRIAGWILTYNKISDSPERIILASGCISFFLSMWASNTATVAMLTPLCLSILTIYGDVFEDKNDQKRFALSLLLMTAYGATIGGIATPVGSPPNLLTVQFLGKLGISISFMSWMSFSLPLAIVMFFCTYFLLRVLFHPKGKFSDEQKRLLHKKLHTSLSGSNSITLAEYQVAACFTLTVVLWLLPDILLLFSYEDLSLALRQRVPISVAALIGATLLFALPVDSQQQNLMPSDLRQVDWSTILLFGGGLSLGAMLSSTGLAQDLCRLVMPETMSGQNLIAIISGVLALFFTEVASNTASASIFLSVLAGFLGENITREAATPMLMVGIATSFGFMMPIATPPNALVFATGQVPLRKMMQTGLILNVLGILLLSIALIVLKLHLWF